MLHAAVQHPPGPVFLCRRGERPQRIIDVGESVGDRLHPRPDEVLRTGRDGDAGDDFIVTHGSFTASYSSIRNTPNWVSYDLEASHFGPEDRCDCFTADPLAPPVEDGLTTADYTGAGAFHGYGIDRGHLVRSADRTAGSLDNATTFYFSNIIPQFSDNNQGPWAQFEKHLGALAQSGNTEVCIIAGASGGTGSTRFRFYDTKLGRPLKLNNYNDRMRLQGETSNMWLGWVHAKW